MYFTSSSPLVAKMWFAASTPELAAASMPIVPFVVQSPARKMPWPTSRSAGFGFFWNSPRVHDT